MDEVKNGIWQQFFGKNLSCINLMQRDVDWASLQNQIGRETKEHLTVPEA